MQQSEEHSELTRSAAEATEKAASDAAKRELDMRKAFYEAGEIEDKREYDRGLITLAQYYDRRAIAIRGKTEDEIAAIQKERAAVQVEISTVGALPAGRTATEQAAHTTELSNLANKISDLDAKEHNLFLAVGNELAKSEDDRHTAVINHRRQELELEKQLAEDEGSRRRVDEASAKLAELKYTEQLQQANLTKAQIDATLAEVRSARSSKTTGEEAQKTFEGGTAGLTARKDQLEEQVAAHQILPYQAAQQLSAEYRKQIPMLQAQVLILREQAAVVLATAKAHGDTGPNEIAEGFTKQADEDTAKIAKLQTEIAKADLGWMEWKKFAESAIDEVSTHLTTGLNGWITGSSALRPGHRPDLEFDRDERDRLHRKDGRAIHRPAFEDAALQAGHGPRADGQHRGHRRAGRSDPPGFGNQKRSAGCQSGGGSCVQIRLGNGSVSAQRGARSRSWLPAHLPARWPLAHSPRAEPSRQAAARAASHPAALFSAGKLPAEGSAAQGPAPAIRFRFSRRMASTS